MVSVNQVSAIKRTKLKEIYLCFATCEDKEYEFFIYYDVKADEYIFYYSNGDKPDYPDFEYEVICTGWIR